MKPLLGHNALFDKKCNHVGWLSDRYIFDINLVWVAYVNMGKIWSVGKKNLIGELYGNNGCDTTGKTVFWNPETEVRKKTIISPAVPPAAPQLPPKPLRQLKQPAPQKPLKPQVDERVWSELSWKKFIDQ